MIRGGLSDERQRDFIPYASVMEISPISKGLRRARAHVKGVEWGGYALR